MRVVDAESFGCASTVSVVAAFANAAGTGGGPLYVALLGVWLHLETRDAAALSQSLVFFASITSTMMHATRKHPFWMGWNALDTGLLLGLQPMFMAGVSYGVLFNTIAPDEWVCTGLMVVLVIVATLTTKKGINMWNKETRYGKHVMYSSYGWNMNGLSSMSDGNRASHGDQDVLSMSMQDRNSVEQLRIPLLDEDRRNSAIDGVDRGERSESDDEGSCEGTNAHGDPSHFQEDQFWDPQKRADRRRFLMGCMGISACSWMSFLILAYVRFFGRKACSTLYLCSLLLDLPLAYLWTKLAMWWVNQPHARGGSYLYQETSLPEAKEDAAPLFLHDGMEEEAERGGVQGQVLNDESQQDDDDRNGEHARPRIHGKESGMAREHLMEVEQSSLVSSRMPAESMAIADCESCGGKEIGQTQENPRTIVLGPCKVSGLEGATREIGDQDIRMQVQRRENTGQPPTQWLAHGTETPNHIQKHVGLLPLWALLGGGAAGALGFGGSVVLSPLLLSLNVHPQVTAAVCSAIVFCSSSLAALQFWLAGRIEPSEALTYGVSAMVGSTLGVIWISAAIHRSGRASITVFLLSSLIGLSAVVVFFLKFLPALHRGDIHFHPLCG